MVTRRVRLSRFVPRTNCASLHCQGSSLFMPVDSPDGTGGSLRLRGNNFSERLRVALLQCNNLFSLCLLAVSFHSRSVRLNPMIKKRPGVRRRFSFPLSHAHGLVVPVNIYRSATTDKVSCCLMYVIRYRGNLNRKSVLTPVIGPVADIEYW